MKRVAIIGAGPMGLALAFFLRQTHACTVFEADDRPGGMSASFDFDGLTIERYYHFINTPDTHFFALLRQLDMEGELRWQPTKMGFFRAGRDGQGRLHPWGNPVALLKLNEIPLMPRLRYGLHAFSCKFLKDLSKLDGISAATWIRRWEGQAGYDIFWRFLFEKKFFELAAPLSAAWIASRIRRVANSRQSLMQETLGYLECGSQGLVSALVRAVCEAGGQVRLSTPVTGITPTGHGGIVRTSSGEEHYETICSTIPLPWLPQLAPELPTPWLDRVRQIRNIGCACALFRLRQPLTDNFWLNVDMPGWDIPGIIEYSNLRPMDKAHVYVPFYMPQTHPNWQLDDTALLEKARSYLRGVNSTAAATEEAARLFRYTYAQPVCPPGFWHVLPGYATGAPGIWAADTAHSYPEDRSINESVRIAEGLAALVRQEV